MDYMLNERAKPYYCYCCCVVVVMAKKKILYVDT